MQPTSPWLDLVQHQPTRSWNKGEIIFLEGDRGDALHVIDVGFVAIRKCTADGDELTLRILGPGESFGEQALLSASGRRTATAAALTSVSTRVLDRTRFQALRRSSPELADQMIDWLSESMHRLSDQLIDALFAPADQRVLRRLVDLAPLFDDGTPPVTVRVTQEELASMAGVRRQTVNAALRDAQDAGVLRLRRGVVDIIDRAGLADRAGSPQSR
jgi:CRP-like cAMP-binding protein